ncbi:hypothetical protein BH11ACT6_BH11ACT6_01700 [soil metagenome]
MSATIELPDTQTVDGNQLTTLIADPCWVYAWTTTEPDGTVWLSVLKSGLIRNSDTWLAPVSEMIAAGELVHRETRQNSHFMWDEAELTVYSVAA